MGELQLDDLIAVRVFIDDTEQKGLAYVEEGTVAKAKQTLDEDFKTEGSFRRGPLRLPQDRELELGCIYSYYLMRTSMILFHSYDDKQQGPQNVSKS